MGWIQIDERSEHISGKLSYIFLSLTQAGLLFLIIYQRYIQNRPPAYYNDLVIIFSISLIGYWLLSFFLGGVLPELSASLILVVYLAMVLMIAVPYTIIRGLPEKEIIKTWILVIFGGPGLLLGGYVLAAYLGRKRLDRLSEPEV